MYHFIRIVMGSVVVEVCNGVLSGDLCSASVRVCVVESMEELALLVVLQKDHTLVDVKMAMPMR